MRSILRVAVLGFLAFSLCAGNSLCDEPLSFSLKDVTVAEAVRLVFDGEEHAYKLDSSVAEKRVPDLVVDGASRKQALTLICRVAGMVAEDKSGVTVFALKPSNPNPESNEDAGVVEATATVSCGMTRADVEGLRGKPDRIEYGQVDGCEKWLYGDDVVEFRSCRVWSIGQLETTGPVTMGSRSTASSKQSSHRQTLSNQPRINISYPSASELLILSPDYRAKSVYVRGYTRKDGTYVHSYYRSPPRKR